jgi:hypothetical protein
MGLRNYSRSREGSYHKHVYEYENGNVLFTAYHEPSNTTEEIALERYVDAHEIKHDPYEGWTLENGQEIPYKEIM